MSLAQISVDKKTVAYFATVLLTLAGLYSFTQLGQLEDPEFTIKTAVVVTRYPGASPEEVELEVTDVLEQVIQQIPELDNIESRSQAGLSVIKVNIRETSTKADLPQIWDTLRKKISDARRDLPSAAGEPDVGDDYGDVFGLLMAMTGDGFSYAQLDDYAEYLKKELSLVPGVAKVEFWGTRARCIYVDVSQAQLAELGIAPITVQQTLAQQNAVVDAGSMNVQGNRFRVAPTGEFESPEDIGNLVIRGIGGAGQSTDELIRVADVATVTAGYVEPPFTLMRYNGKPSLGLAISNVSGANVVDMGRAVQSRLEELKATLPIGIEIHRISWQSDLISDSIAAFALNLVEAIIIVLVVLAVAMGVRVALIVGFCGLVLTIVWTFLVMYVWGIDLQRMSLGALIVSMGMMVDNAIVVADGVLIRLRQGMNRVQAAVEAAAAPSWPLLGATVVAVATFYPIYAAPSNTGEYCASLFQVIGASLLLSWLLSVTVTPLACVALLSPSSDPSDSGDLYGGRLYTGFRSVLEWSLRMRRLCIGTLVVLLVGSFVAFGWVDKTFFPDSTRAQFMVDYWAPEGTRIGQVESDLRRIEVRLLEDASVEAVVSFIGSGPPRFYLPVTPEDPNSSYAQLIVNTNSWTDIDPLIDRIKPWLRDNVPEAMTVVIKYGMGPSETWKIQARFSGPAQADAEVLRDLSEQAKAIIRQNPATDVVRSNWRQRVTKIVPVYDQERARWAGVSRADLARTTRRAHDGTVAGVFRDGDELLPIIVRQPEQQRRTAAADLAALQIRPLTKSKSIPLLQVVDGIHLEAEDPMIWRWDRRRAITVEAIAVMGSSSSQLLADVMPQVEAIELPAGYELTWDGEYDSQRSAQESLIPGMIPAALIIAFIVVALFNAFRPPLVILATIPFAMIGITFGLLLTGASFGFMALLGAMSLTGMMIKNAIVLLDQVSIEQGDGATPYDAIVRSAVSRLRPVVLAAATTILGMLPLLQDPFWISMAVTIMFGLLFGTVLTMLAVPLWFVVLYRIKSPVSS